MGFYIFICLFVKSINGPDVSFVIVFSCSFIRFVPFILYGNFDLFCFLIHFLLFSLQLWEVF